jgi:hypothetical protein
MIMTYPRKNTVIEKKPGYRYGGSKAGYDEQQRSRLAETLSGKLVE